MERIMLCDICSVVCSWNKIFVITWTNELICCVQDRAVCTCEIITILNSSSCSRERHRQSRPQTTPSVQAMREGLVSQVDFLGPGSPKYLECQIAHLIGPRNKYCITSTAAGIPRRRLPCAAEFLTSTASNCREAAAFALPLSLTTSNKPYMLQPRLCIITVACWNLEVPC